jgi:Calponin homology (CH) domain
MYVQAESWITVFYQVLRIYYLNRVTPKNFKTLPGMPTSETTVETAMTKSNVYSVSETILLKWMQYHYNQQNQLHPKTLYNFDSDLQDGTVFAALIRSHYGEPENFKKFRNVAADKHQRDKNIELVIQAVKEIGITTHITESDIKDPSSRELLLFCVQLYQALPHYIPKATIEFPAILNDIVTKNIELSNPSKLPIAYYVKLIGSTDF